AAGNLQFNTTTPAGATTTPVTVSSGAPNNSIFVASNGNVGIGTDNPQGRLDVTARDGNGNLGGFYPPSMTTFDRDHNIPGAMLREGMMIYNTDTHQLEVYRPGVGWVAVGGALGRNNCEWTDWTGEYTNPGGVWCSPGKYAAGLKCTWWDPRDSDADNCKLFCCEP
ncbi:MAG: hypothetical protein PHT53_01885, partial [Candidatus Omnitrophica bacterium]|nr:hypothetical protein [Candidatus Omnitrophota bacterium]